jgi:CBS domain-containing protein
MTAYEKLTAGDIMTRALVCARPEQPLLEAESMLIERRIGGAPVVEAGGLVGVISRSDIGRVEVLMLSLDGLVSDQLQWKVQADGFEHSRGPEFAGFRDRLSKLKVKDAMHREVTTCHPDTPVAEVAATMVRQHIHRLIVVVAGRPVGIVSSLDIVKLVAQADEKPAI